MDTPNKDFFGQPLEIGDYVVTAWNTVGEPSVSLYKIMGFTDSNVRVVRVEAKKPKVAHRRAKNLVKVDPALVTFRTLQK
jgi:hypothetical protein